MKVKEESEKVGLKLNIHKTKIMASGPITSWQIDEETVETVDNFIFLGSKITADGDCNHEKEQNYAICSHTDRPRDCLTECGKSDKEKQIHMISLYVESKRGVQVNLSTKRK